MSLEPNSANSAIIDTANHNVRANVDTDGWYRKYSYKTYGKRTPLAYALNSDAPRLCWLALPGWDGLPGELPHDARRCSHRSAWRAALLSMHRFIIAFGIKQPEGDDGGLQGEPVLPSSEPAYNALRYSGRVTLPSACTCTGDITNCTCTGFDSNYNAASIRPTDPFSSILRKSNGF